MDPVAEQAAPGSRQYLTFHVGSEVFGVGILAVKEIIGYAALTAVPLMPACVRGVINLRGQVVPVVDLSLRFGRALTAGGRRACIIILETRLYGERQDVGIIVDAVDAVLDVPVADIAAAPSFGARIRSDFIAGIGRVGDRFVILIDVEPVLAIEEVAALARTPEQAA